MSRLIHVKVTSSATLMYGSKCLKPSSGSKVSKGAKIRNRYNQVPHLTQDTNGKMSNSQLDTTNESQEVMLEYECYIINRR